MIRSFGARPGKTKTSEKRPSLISTLMEEEKVINEKYKMLTPAEKEEEEIEEEEEEEDEEEQKVDEKVIKEKYEMLTLTENVSNEKCEVRGKVEMEEVNVNTKDSVHLDEVSKQEIEIEMNEGPKNDSVMETKIQELYSLLLQNGDEERIENFQKFVLNQQSC